MRKEAQPAAKCCVGVGHGAVTAVDGCTDDSGDKCTHGRGVGAAVATHRSQGQAAVLTALLPTLLQTQTAALNISNTLERAASRPATASNTTANVQK